MSAGISYNDIATQKKYLRYNADYFCKWIEFFSQIEECVEKFDGKKVTKRIDTAIKNIDSRLAFRIEKSSYNPSEGYVYLDWYDYDGRRFKDETSGQWDYVKDFSRSGIAMLHVENMESFDAKEFVSELNKQKKYYEENRDNVYDATENIESLKSEYNAAIKAYKEVVDNIPSVILDYYRVEHPYIREWM